MIGLADRRVVGGPHGSRFGDGEAVGAQAQVARLDSSAAPCRPRSPTAARATRCGGGYEQAPDNGIKPAAIRPEKMTGP